MLETVDFFNWEYKKSKEANVCDSKKSKEANGCDSKVRAGRSTRFLSWTWIYKVLCSEGRVAVNYCVVSPIL